MHAKNTHGGFTSNTCGSSGTKNKIAGCRPRKRSGLSCVEVILSELAYTSQPQCVGCREAAKAKGDEASTDRRQGGLHDVDVGVDQLQLLGKDDGAQRESSQRLGISQPQIGNYTIYGIIAPNRLTFDHIIGAQVWDTSTTISHISTTR
eukprot:6210184-Pleurochrysis_carterae.AAC.1